MIGQTTSDIGLTAVAPAVDSSISPLVRLLFSLFDEHKILWAVLRGGGGLPDHTRYDIDLLVSPNNLKQAESLVEQAAATLGWKKIRIVNKYQYRCWLLVSPGIERQFLPIDLFSGCYHRFYPFADAGYALEHRQRNSKGVWMVPLGFGAWVTLAKELMRFDHFKENSRDEVRRSVMEDPDSFVAAANPYLEQPLTHLLLEACQKDDWKTVGAVAVQIRRQIWGQRLKQIPAAMLFFWKNLVHNFKPPMSMFVVLLGPDGAGKSTVADKVCEHLYHRPFKVCKRFEYNFRLLPQLKSAKIILGRLMGRKVKLAAPVAPGTKGSGMNKEHGALRAMGYIGYYSMDLIFGRLILQKLRGQGSLILFARYFYDYYFQKGYGSAPRWFLRSIEKLLPAPDLILYLHRDAAEIYAGKPELDIAEIQRQQSVIKSLLEGRANAMIIDASGGVESTVQRVNDVILEKFLTDR